MSASRSLFCRLCNKRFSSESDLFKHNLSWEHRCKQEAQSSRSSPSDTSSHRENPKTLPHAKPSHDGQRKGMQSQQSKTSYARTQPLSPPHRAPPYHHGRSYQPPSSRGLPSRHPSYRGPSPRDPLPNHKYTHPPPRHPPLMDYVPDHRHQVSRYLQPRGYPITDRYMPPPLSLSERVGRGDYHSPRSESERLYDFSSRNKSTSSNQNSSSKSDLPSASLNPSKQQKQPASNKITSSSETKSHTVLQTMLQHHPQRSASNSSHSTSSTTKDSPLQSNAGSTKRNVSIADPCSKLVPPLAPKRAQKKSLSGDEGMLQPKIPENENFLPLEVETEDGRKGKSTTANSTGGKVLSNALPFAGTIYDSSTPNNEETNAEPLHNVQATSASRTIKSSTEHHPTPKPLFTDSSDHGSADEPVPMDLCTDTDSNDEVFRPSSVSAKNTQSGTHSTGSLLASGASVSSTTPKKAIVSEFSAVIPNHASVGSSGNSGLSELLKATTLVLASVGRNDQPTKASTCVPSNPSQTTSTSSDRVSSLVTSVLQADVAKQLATNKKATLPSKSGTPKGKRKATHAVSANPQKRRRLSSSDIPSTSRTLQEVPAKQRKKSTRALDGSASSSEAQNATVSNDQNAVFPSTKERCDHDALKQSIFLEAQKLQALGAPLPHRKQNKRPTPVQISNLQKQNEESAAAHVDPNSPGDTRRPGASTNIPMRGLKAHKVTVSRNLDGCERAVADVLSKTLQQTMGAVLSRSPSRTPGSSPVHSPRGITKPSSLPISQSHTTTESRLSSLSSNEHTPQDTGEEPRKLGSYSPSHPNGPPPPILDVSLRAALSRSQPDAIKQSLGDSTTLQLNSVGCTWRNCSEKVFKPGAKLCSKHNLVFEKLLSSSGIMKVSPPMSSNKPSKQQPYTKSVLFGDLAGAPSWMLPTTVVDVSMEETNGVLLSKTSPAEVQKPLGTQESTPATETPVRGELERVTPEVTGGPGVLANDTPNPPNQTIITSVGPGASCPASETVGHNPTLSDHPSIPDRLSGTQETPQRAAMSPSFRHDFKAEITALNATEKQLQEDLLGAQSELLAALERIEQVEKDLEQVKSQLQQLQDKVVELTQLYKEVLWKKQSAVLHPLQKSTGKSPLAQEERPGSSGSQHLTLVSELAALNQREHKLQEELTDTHVQLSEAHGKIEESTRELEGLREKEQQSREKAEKVTSEYQEVLTKKHNLLVHPMQWSPLCMASSTSQSTPTVSSTCLPHSTNTTTSSVMPASNQSHKTTADNTTTSILSETSDENPLPDLPGGQVQLQGETDTPLPDPPGGQVQLLGGSDISPEETTPDCYITTVAMESQTTEAAMDQAAMNQSASKGRSKLSRELHPVGEGSTQAASPSFETGHQGMEVGPPASTDVGLIHLQTRELERNEPDHELASPVDVRHGSTSLLDTIATSHLEQSSNNMNDGILRCEKDDMHVDSIEAAQSEQSASSSGTRRVQNADMTQTGPSGRVVPVFQPHESSVLAMKFSGNRLYTCSADRSIRAYDTLTGEVVHNYHPHQRSVTCLELYQRDGTTILLSGSSDKVLHQYNAETGKLETKYKCGVRVMYLCTEGTILYVGLSSGSIIVIDLELSNSIGKQSCSVNHSSISCLCAAPGVLFSAAFDMSVTCWDVREALEKRFTDDTSFREVHRITSFENTVLCMKIHNDHLYSGCGDKTVQIHNIKTWERVGVIRGHSGAVSGLQIIGKVLITACFDQLVRCFDIERLQLLQVYGGHSDMLFTICAANGIIYTGLKNGQVQATPLDLTVFYECQWKECGLRFGIFQHLKDHVKNHIELGDDGQFTCKWNECSERLDPPESLQHLWQHVSSNAH